MRAQTLIGGLAAAAATAALALAVPAMAQGAGETVAVTGGEVHTGTSVIENGTVVFRNGRIVSVGTGPAPAGARIIDARGRIVTPGFVAVDSGLGGSEVSSVPGSDDMANRSNTLSAAFDVSWGLDPWSFTLPVARLGGLTRAVVVPIHAGSSNTDIHEHDAAGAGEGGYHDPGLFGGQAAVIHHGQGPDILVRSRVAMAAPFGEAGAGVAGGARGAAYVLFRETLAEVRLYARNRGAYERAGLRDLMLSRADLEALVPVAEGRMPLIISAHRAADILQVLRLAREEGLQVILDGAEEGWLVADQIAAARVPVLLDATANLPGSFETRAAHLGNAAALNAAGVTIAIKGVGVHRAREARYNAGNAVAHGLPHAAALAALTVNPARIFGDEGRYGVLAPGAEADVVVWSGDPLEPLSQPEVMFIAGAQQPLTSRGLMLRDRYRDGGEGALPPAYSR